MTINEAPTTEKGHGQTSIVPWTGLSDVIEQTPELMWPNSITVYDLMRRTESQLAGVLRAISYPIRNYRWFIDPNGADPDKVKVIAEDMGLPIKGEEPRPQRRRKGRFSFQRYLRHALLSGVYGHMFFEQFGVIEDNLWRLRKLAPRMPLTIQEIKVARDGGLEGIKQFGTGKPGAPQSDDIPVSQLLAIVNEQEGGNWFGQSWLRAAYKHWLIKDRLLRVDAIKHERGGIGIPIIEAMQNATAAQLRELSAMAQKWKVGESAGGSTPYGTRLRLVGTEGTLPDTLGSIRYHDEQMSKLMLVQFIDLGTSGAGNRALGEAFIDFFDLSLQTTAQDICDVTTEHQIEDQWEWNWGDDDQACILGFEKPDDPSLSVEELTKLVDSGVIKADEELEDAVRDRHGLPKRVEVNPPVAPTPPPAPPPTPPPAPDPTARGRHPFGRPGRAVTAKVQLSSGRETRRELYSYEIRAKIDFVGIDARWEAASSGIVSDWQAIKAQQIESLVDQIADAASQDDLEALAQIEAPVLGADLIEEYMRAQAEWAIDTALDEAAAQGFTIPAPAADGLEETIADRATATALILAKGLSEAAGREALRRNAEIVDGFDVADQVLSHLDSLSDAHLRKVLGGCLSAAQNWGRFAVFHSAEDAIAENVQAKRGGVVKAAEGDPPGAMRVYASELLDANTCPACYGLDGTEYATVEDAEQDYPGGGYVDCDGGDWCRGTPVGVFAEGDDDLPQPGEPPPAPFTPRTPEELLNAARSSNALSPASLEQGRKGGWGFRGEDGVHKLIAEEMGHTGLPTVVTEAEMDAIWADSEFKLYRGVQSDEYAELFRTGEYFSGSGVWGSGTYIGSTGSRIGETVAEVFDFCSDYAGIGNSGMMRLSFVEDINLIGTQELQAEMKAFNDYLDELLLAATDSAEVDYLFALKNELADPGRYSAFQGYDGFIGGRAAEGNGEIILSNRSKAIVQDTRPIKPDSFRPAPS